MVKDTMIKWRELALWAFRGIMVLATFVLAAMVDTQAGLKEDIDKLQDRTGKLENFTSKSELNQENLKELILRVDGKVDKVGEKIDKLIEDDRP